MIKILTLIVILVSVVFVGIPFAHDVEYEKSYNYCLSLYAYADNGNDLIRTCYLNQVNAMNELNVIFERDPELVSNCAVRIDRFDTFNWQLTKYCVDSKMKGK